MGFSYWSLEGSSILRPTIDLGCGSVPTGEVNLDLFLGFSPHHQGEIEASKYRLFVQGDVTRLPFRDKSLGRSKLSHVLEHVDNPLQVLREVVRITQDLVIITVPNHRILEEEHPAHLYSWSRSSLLGLVKRAGLTPVKVAYYSRPNWRPHLRRRLKVFKTPLIGSFILRLLGPYLELELQVVARP